MKTNTIHKLSALILVLAGIMPLKTQAQSPILLTEDDVPGFYISYKDNSGATAPYYYKSYYQNWKSIDDNDTYFEIDYYFLNNEKDAIRWTRHNIHEMVYGSVYGSLDDQILGNASWLLPYDESIPFDLSIINIQKWNINIQCTPIIDSVLVKVINKINRNVDESFKELDNRLQENQTSMASYNRIASGITGLLTEKGFVQTITDSTKWVVPNDSLLMGLRKQWTNDHSLVGIDITHYPSPEAAEAGAKYFANILEVYYCNLENYDSITTVLNDLSNDRSSHLEMYLTVVGWYGYFAVLFHYFDKNGFDMDFYETILKSTQDGGTGIDESPESPVKVYPALTSGQVQVEYYPAKKAGYGLKVFNAKGQAILKQDVGFPNSYTFDLSGNPAGFYFVNLKNSEENITRKIVLQK